MVLEMTNKKDKEKIKLRRKDKNYQERIKRITQLPEEIDS